MIQQTVFGSGGQIGRQIYTYDGAGNQLTDTDAYGNKTIDSYDGNQLVREVVVSAAGATVSYSGSTDNADGEQTYATAGDGTVTANTYEGSELADTVVTDRGGNVVTAEKDTYDQAGNLRTSTDALGDVTFNAYDGNELMSSTVGYGSPAAATTAYTYDLNGNVQTLTDPDGNKTTYTYNADNNVLTSTNALGQKTTYQYDGNGNVSTLNRPDGSRIAYQYEDNRLMAETWYGTDGQTVVATQSYTYDAAGNMLSASNSAGTYTMTYNGNQLVSRTDPNGLTLTYGYDQNGNTTSIRDSLGGSTTMAYNAANEMTNKTYQDASRQLREDFTYDPAGNVLTTTRFSDAAGTKLVGSTQYAYDAGQVTSIVHKDASGIILASYSYVYDKAGRVASETDNGVTTNYAYDAASQLIQAGTEKFQYDPNGNPNGPGYVIGPNNQLLSDGTWNYSYDANGNQVKKVNIADGMTWTYAYNNVNQMTSATQTDARGKVLMHADYVYDAFGNRVEKTVTTGKKQPVTTRFAYDGSEIWADLDASGNLQTRYIRGSAVDQLLARVDSKGKVEWYLTDHLGSVRGILNAQGQLLDAIDYDAFGNVTNETNPNATGRYTYTGRVHDSETGLIQSMIGRAYGPEERRYLGLDSLGTNGGSNLYEYANNNPANEVDPWGTDGVPGPLNRCSTISCHSRPAEKPIDFQGLANDLQGLLNRQKRSDETGRILQRVLNNPPPKPAPPAYANEHKQAVQALMVGQQQGLYGPGVNSTNQAKLPSGEYVIAFWLPGVAAPENTPAGTRMLALIRAVEVPNPNYLQGHQAYHLGLDLLDYMQRVKAERALLDRLNEGVPRTLLVPSQVTTQTRGAKTQFPPETTVQNIKDFEDDQADVESDLQTFEMVVGIIPGGSTAITLADIQQDVDRGGTYLGAVASRPLQVAFIAVDLGAGGAAIYSGVGGAVRLSRAGIGALGRGAASEAVGAPSGMATARSPVWSSATGDVVVNGANLPGSAGVEVGRRLTVAEMQAMTQAHGVEFSLVYEIGPGRNGGGGTYWLRSGTVNDVAVPIGPEVRWIYHTHAPPLSVPYASGLGGDQSVLARLIAAGSPQRSSVVIPVPGQPFRFNIYNTRLP